MSQYSTRKFPFKVPFIIAVVVVWNALIFPYFLDFFRDEITPTSIVYFLVALGFMAVLCLLLIGSAKFRRLALKEGYTFSDIKRVVFMFLAVALVIIITYLPGLLAD